MASHPNEVVAWEYRLPRHRNLNKRESSASMGNLRGIGPTPRSHPKADAPALSMRLMEVVRAMFRCIPKIAVLLAEALLGLQDVEGLGAGNSGLSFPPLSRGGQWVPVDITSKNNIGRARTAQPGGSTASYPTHQLIDKASLSLETSVVTFRAADTGLPGCQDSGQAETTTKAGSMHAHRLVHVAVVAYRK